VRNPNTIKEGVRRITHAFGGSIMNIENTENEKLNI